MLIVAMHIRKTYFNYRKTKINTASEVRIKGCGIAGNKKKQYNHSPTLTKRDLSNTQF